MIKSNDNIHVALEKVGYVIPASAAIGAGVGAMHSSKKKRVRGALAGGAGGAVFGTGGLVGGALGGGALSVLLHRKQIEELNKKFPKMDAKTFLNNPSKYKSELKLLRRIGTIPTAAALGGAALGAYGGGRLGAALVGGKKKKNRS